MICMPYVQYYTAQECKTEIFPLNVDRKPSSIFISRMEFAILANISQYIVQSNICQKWQNIYRIHIM